MPRDRDKFRKFDSGFQKLKKKEKREEFLKTQEGAFEKFLKPLDAESPSQKLACSSSSTSEISNRSTEATKNVTIDGDAITDVTLDQESPDDASKNILDISNEDASLESHASKQFSHSPEDTLDNLLTLSSAELSFDIVDPGTWPVIMQTVQLDEIIKKGPLQIINFHFPINSDKRHFSADFYSRTLLNGEKNLRRWLVYSKNKDAAFCFCCKLFGNASGGKLAADGFCDWRHISTRLQSHEQSVGHSENIQKWIECELRLAKEVSINEKHINLIKKEREYWREVLKRIIQVIKYLAERNIALRGSTCKLYDPNNGNFLGLIEMIATFDPILQEHVRRIKSSEIHDHYLGIRIQNELMQLMAEKVKKRNIDEIKKAKYFSIILDCTPDISHEEQMSMIIRFVKIKNCGTENDLEGISVEEHFISFLAVKSTTGKSLTDVLLEELDIMNMSINDCRGQGYDNGSNMKGVNSGVQSRILQINPKAFYMPCASHSLNLVICDAAKCTPKAMTFFGVLQRTFVLFSASTKRWSILKKHVPNLTVKKLCETRWESKIESVRALRYQIKEIKEALSEVAETTDDVKAKSEAKSLLHVINRYEFLLTLAIWHDLLFSVNSVSNNLQSISMNLGQASQLLEGLVKFLERFREEGFATATMIAREMSETLGINPDFQEVRQRKKKKQFDYEAEDEPISDSTEKAFKVDFFYRIVDCAIQSIKRRFEQMTDYNSIFGFLYNLKELKSISEKDLLQKCRDLEKDLSFENERDICAQELFTELQVLRQMLPSETETAAGVLRFLNKIQNPFPNAFIAYRILLTIPVTVASVERSFSRLKVIKTYLRSSMSQERLTSLATLSIEADTTAEINFDDLIDDFAGLKARKINFL